MILKMTNKIKIAIVLAIGVLISLFMIFGFTTNASTSSGTDFNNSDKSKYNTSWSAGTAKHWTYTEPVYSGMWWWKKLDSYATYNFIRLEDKEGNLIDSSKITYLVAKFEVDGEKYVVEQYADEIIFKFGKYSGDVLNDPYGALLSHESFDNVIPGDSGMRVKNIFKADKYNYETTNLCWVWEFEDSVVCNIMEMYVWYQVENVGGAAGGATSIYEEVATSFVSDDKYEGLHPMYDETGELTGIFDADGNLAEGYSLSTFGMICDAEGTEIDLTDEQTQGSVIITGDTGANNNDNSGLSLEGILKLMLGIAGCVALVYVASLLIKVINNIARK